MDPLDIIAVIIFFGCVSVYGVALLCILQRPAYAKRGLLNIFYVQWVEKVAHHEDNLLAVQTMRNLIMSVTFLASSVLIMMGILVSSFEGINGLITFATEETTGVGQYKILLLFLVLLFTLSMFLLSLRQMNRFSILISIPQESIQKTVKDRHDVDVSNLRTITFLKATNRFTFGIRGIFFSVAVMLWFISPLAFMIATFIITFLLIAYRDIRAPYPEQPPV
jgi:uncharacterized membrane protein